MDLLDHPVVAERYFFPRPEPPPVPWRVQVDGAALACARTGANGGRALLFFHGNGEVVADWVGDFAAAFERAGIDGYFAEYRGYGGSSGRPALATMLGDALAIADATGVRPADLVVYGRSIGSLFAAHVASRRRVRALVLESGIADLYERLAIRLRAAELGATDEALCAAVHATFDQRAKLEAATCPVLVLHARGDHLVPPHHAERLAGWAGSRGELVLFDRGDHNTIHAFNRDEIVARTIALTRD